jgi:hypothetical protein
MAVGMFESIAGAAKHSSAVGGLSNAVIRRTLRAVGFPATPIAAVGSSRGRTVRAATQGGSDRGTLRETVGCLAGCAVGLTLRPLKPRW